MRASAERGVPRTPARATRAGAGRRPASILAVVVVAVVACVLSSTEGQAQVRASERATVSQTVDGTVLTINYSRPRARGRSELFGKAVAWGEVWTPGANWATTLELNRDATLDGRPVKKGKYSVWFVVRPNAWTMVLDPRFQLYHEEHPDSTADQLRWTVTPTEVAFAEILTWSFPEVRPDGAVLQFEWATKRVTINTTVSPSHPLTISRADAEPFLGTYEWKWEDAGDASAGTVELYYKDGGIKQRYTPFPDWYPRLQDQPMVRINDAWFIPAIIRDGKVWEMVADQIFEFEVVGARSVGFEMRSDKDELLGRGTRVAGK
ncbi:MAG: DUF2911 domain-containing protein [Gemmatimonadaceae bacterium]